MSDTKFHQGYVRGRSDERSKISSMLTVYLTMEKPPEVILDLLARYADILIKSKSKEKPER